MKNETSHKRPKEKDLLKDYKEIVGFAHSQIEDVRSYYKWIFVGFSILVSIALVLTTILIGKSISDVKEQVQTKIDKAFDEKNIQDMIEKAAMNKVEQIAVPLINKDVNEVIMPKIQVAEEKLSTLDEATKNAQKALAEIERTTEFAIVLLSAQNDDWNAFDQLRRWYDDKSFPFNELAANAFLRIRLNYYTVIDSTSYPKIDWPPDVDPSIFSIQQFLMTLKALNKGIAPMKHIDLANIVWNRTDIPKKDRMMFLLEVLQTSNSIAAKNFAANLFVKAANDKDLKWQPFHIEPIKQWWEEHGGSIN